MCLSVQQLETLCQTDVLAFEKQNRKAEIHEKLKEVAMHLGCLYCEWSITWVSSHTPSHPSRVTFTNITLCREGSSL